MASYGFGAWSVVNQPWVVEHPKWQMFLEQFNHPAWHGCTLWDLVFPSFLFVIGVAMPYSYRSRSERGQSWKRQVRHAIVRGMILYALGDFIVSYTTGHLQTNFPVVLQQIGVCYVLAFLLLRLHPGLQIGIAIALLVAHSAAYLFYGGHAGDPWAKEHNVGYYVQLHWLHLPARNGNTALNAVTGLVNVIFGLLCGRLLLTNKEGAFKVAVMLLAGTGTMVAGWGLAKHFSISIPVNKWLWTSSYTLWTGGFTFLFMAVLYLVIDMLRLHRWAFPFVVVGMNSIAVYVVAQLCQPGIQRAINLFLPEEFKATTIAYPVVLSLLTLLVI